MRCILVNPPSPPGKHVMRSYSGGFGDLVDSGPPATQILFPPVELLRFATASRAIGYSVGLFDFQADPKATEMVRSELMRDQPDLLLVSTSLPTFEHDTAFVDTLVNELEKFRLIFVTSVRHPHVLSHLLNSRNCYAVVTPDAAANLSAVLSGIAAENVSILGDDGQLLLSPLVNIEPADLLPAPAFDLLDFAKYKFPVFREKPDNFVVTLHSSYGCSYPCGFYCPYPLAEGKRVRRHSIARIISEIEDAISCGAKSIVFRDPLFSGKPSFVDDLCAEILKREISVRWWCESRIDRLPSQLLANMKRAGCVGMEVGVESGDEQIMVTKGKVGLTLDKVREFHSITRQLGLHVVYLFLFGLPGERKSSLVKTVRLIYELGLKPDEFNISIITPYPGTPLHQLASSKNWIEGDPSKFTGYSVNMRTDVLTSDDLRAASSFAAQLSELRTASAEAVSGCVDSSALLRKMEEWACSDNF